MIRRPPKSPPLSHHAALPIYPSEERRAPVDPAELVALATERGAASGVVVVVAMRDVIGGPLGDAVAVAFALASRRSEEHTSELQSRQYIVCRILLEKKIMITL